MKLKKNAVPTFVALALALPGFAGSPAPAMGQSSEAPKWGPHIDMEAKPGTKRSLGEADLFLPLLQNERTLLFGNLRGRLDDGDGREGNLGLGVRRMLEGGWNLGGYGYLDRRRSENHNFFNQVTLGAEALGRDWDLRANAYLPRGSRVRTLGTTTVGGGAATAAITGTTVQVTTPGTSTTTSEERALKGYDAEVGWRVPLFEVDEPRQLRVYAGGYRFKDDVVKVSGPRLRAEFTVAELSGLWHGAQIIGGVEVQDDNARGSQTFLSLRIRIPLGGEKEQPRQLSFQERRMTAPVMRDVDIVTQARSVTTTTPALVETATAMDGGQAFTILSSSETAPGTGLRDAVVAAGPNSTVVLSGTFETTVPTALQPGQTLMGAGSLTVRTPSGQVATVTTPVATINGAGGGGIVNPTVLMGNNSTLSGMNITKISVNNTAGLGVVVNSVSGATIENSTITGRETGDNSSQGLLIVDSQNIMVRNNHLSATGHGPQNSIAFNLVNSSATVTGNTMAPVGGGDIRYVTLNGATILPGSTGNVAGQGICSRNGINTGVITFTNVGPCP